MPSDLYTLDEKSIQILALSGWQFYRQRKGDVENRQIDGGWRHIASHETEHAAEDHLAQICAHRMCLRVY